MTLNPGQCSRSSRRLFLKHAGLGLAALSAPSLLTAGGAPAQTAAPPARAGSPIMRRIPKTGEMIPAVGLGTFETFDITPGEPRDNVREVLRLFHEAGGRVVDTS